MSETTGVVRVLADAAAIYRAAAEEFVTRTGTAVQERSAAAVVLASGSTPRGLYHLLAGEGDPGLAARIPWRSIHFFWGDERHVPPDHPNSNYRMAREAMLGRVPVPPACVHRMHTEDADADWVADDYERGVRAYFAARGPMTGDFPRFDLVLLGMGADGHTASLFPGTAVVHEAQRIVKATWVPKLQAHRVTLTPPALNAAAAVVFLVSGEEKAEALRAVLEGEAQPDVYPSQVIHPARGELLWLVDRAAARLLRRPA